MQDLTQLMAMYQQMMKDPAAFISQRFNVPRGMNSPDAIIQYLLNSGQVSQTQVNEAMAMRNSPAVRALMNR